MRNTHSALSALLLIAVGCGGSSMLDGSGGAGAPNSAGATSAAAAGTTNSAGAGDSPGNPMAGASGSGLPCEVSSLLQKYCVSCHSSPPTGGAPQAMLSYTNLSALARSVPTEQVGALSVTRMLAGPMPPKPFPAPSASEQASFKAWVDSGMAMTTCASGAPTNPYDTPLVCSSGQTWTGGNRGSALMHPGGTCISCHSQGGEGPRYSIAGTVFPSAHEPDDCNGRATSNTFALSVLITESNGTSHSLPVNGAGNFFYQGSITTPYLAQVVAGTGVRAMAHSQTSGDCNGCHTVNGASNTASADAAPGRIMAP